MIALNPAGAFFAPIKLAFFVAVFAAAPWLLYQAWAFIAPGLYRREKKLAVPLLGSSVALFYAGCARSEEHTSELQSLMRISYSVFCLTQNTSHLLHTP